MTLRNPYDHKLVGRIYPSNRDGNVEVVAYHSAQDITIRFLNTDNITSTRLIQLKNGKMKDHSVKREKQNDTWFLVTTDDYTFIGKDLKDLASKTKGWQGLSYDAIKSQSCGRAVSYRIKELTCFEGGY